MHLSRKGKALVRKFGNFIVNDVPSQLGIRKVTAGTLEVNTVMINLFEICNIEFEARLVGEGISN